MGHLLDRLAENLDKDGPRIQSAREAGTVKGWLGTGNYALNWAISGRFQRGYPLGHVVEIFGDPSTGKSYLIQRAIASAQQAGGDAMLDDTEKALNPEWAEQALGVNVDELALVHSHTVKEHFDAVTAFIEAVTEEEAGPYVLALDSLAMLTTEHELSVGLDKPSMERAKKLHAMLRQRSGELGDLPVTYLIANHVYSGPQPNFGERPTSGGKGTQYEASVRLDLKTPKKIKISKEVRGVRIKVRVNKNRIVAPFKEVKMVIPFDRSISPVSGFIDTLLNLGFLDTSGHTLTYKGEDTGIKAHKSNLLKQQNSAEKLLNEFPDLLDEVDERLAERQAQVYEG